VGRPGRSGRRVSSLLAARLRHDGRLASDERRDLAHQLAHPKYEVDKVYVVQLWKRPPDGTLRKLAEGVNSTTARPLRRSPAPRRVSTIRAERNPRGRNRQVKRMFEAVATA